jgi:hypothetical protein
MVGAVGSDPSCGLLLELLLCVTEEDGGGVCLLKNAVCCENDRCAL